MTTLPMYWSPSVGWVVLRFRMPEKTIRLIEIGDRARAYEKQVTR